MNYRIRLPPWQHARPTRRLSAAALLTLTFVCVCTFADGTPKSSSPAITAWVGATIICTGTDDDPDFHAVDSRLFDEIWLLVQESNMTPMDALRAATANGASVMGQTAEMGTIASGKLANFVVLRKDPLKDIHNLQTVETVVKRGKVYPRSRYVPKRILFRRLDRESDFPARTSMVR